MTLVDLLRMRAATVPERDAYTFLPDGTAPGPRLTYGDLDRRARAIAATLQAQFGPSARALLLLPQGPDFVAAFFGCLYAGIIAVPAYAPRPNHADRRIDAIAADAAAAVALTTADVLARARGPIDGGQAAWTPARIAVDQIDIAAASGWRAPAVTPATIAHLQYTSGSTSLPKGVMVTHGNLVENLRDLDEGWRHRPDSVIVTWLPPFHDMGLVYGLLEPIYVQVPCVVMPPVAFIQRPIRWLQAMTRFGGTHSAAPNFAYDLCVRKIRPEDRAGLDLSRWRVAANGAEPIRRQTLLDFVDAFGPVGFRQSAFCPGYGLAEATLKVSASHSDEPPVFLSVRTSGIEQNRIETVPPGEDAGARILVGCGAPSPRTRVALVHPASGMECGIDEIGEIWVKGKSVAAGYWKKDAESAATFGATLATGEGPFLRTGDLGVVHDGQVYVTGRLKDVIIIRGQNHYPQDIEQTVESAHAALRAGCTAVFSVQDAGEERLVVVQEVEREARRADPMELAGAIRQAVAQEHELQVSDVVLIRPGSIPKTSSGKIQRRACRAAFLEGTLERWIQVGAGSQEPGAS